MKKKNVLISSFSFLIAAALSLCIGFAVLPNRTVKASAESTIEQTTVTSIYVEGSSVWIGLSGTDYGGQARDNTNYEIFNNLNTLNKIKIDGKYFAEDNSGMQDADPWINLWSKLAGSFRLVLGRRSEIVIEKGCQFPSLDYWVNGNADGIIYEVAETVTFKKTDGDVWVMVLPEEDISDTFSVSLSGLDRDSVMVTLSTSADISAPSSGKWLMDNISELQNFITVNGKTVVEINTETDDSSYEYIEFPGSNGDIYAVPVRVQFVKSGANAEFRIYIHNNYFATIPTSFAVGIKAGFVRANTAADTNMVVTEDVELPVVTKTFVSLNLTDGLQGSGFDAKGYYHAYLYTDLFKGNAGIGYAIIDNAIYKYLANFIYFNGKSVAEINAGTDVAGWDWKGDFPYIINGKDSAVHQVPILLCVKTTNQDASLGETMLEIKLHENYVNSVDGDITVTFKKGLFMYDKSSNIFYTAANDVSSDIYYKSYNLTINVEGQDPVVLSIKHTLALDFSNFCPEKAGYAFSGWFTDAEMTKEATEINMPARDYAVYGKYNATEYTATLTLADGTAHTITYTIENRAAELEKAKALLGTDNAQYEYTNDLPAELPLEDGKTYTESRTVKSYSVVIGDESATVEYGSTIEEPVSAPTEHIDGYVSTFDGWYNGEKKWNFATDVVTENVTLVAKFNRTAIEYTAKIVLGNGTERTVTYTIENRAAKLEEIKTWLAADKGHYAYTDNLPAELPLKDGEVYTETRTAVEYDVVIGETSFKASYGTKLTKPADPEKAPSVSAVFTFDGWYNGEKKWNFDTDVVTGNVTLVAKFNQSVRQYTVTINFIGIEKQAVVSTLDYGTAVDLTQYGEEGYTVVIKLGENEITEYTVDGDVTITVEYSAIDTGCSGSVGGSAVMAMLSALACLSVVCIRKKKED